MTLGGCGGGGGDASTPTQLVGPIAAVALPAPLTPVSVEFSAIPQAALILSADTSAPLYAGDSPATVVPDKTIAATTARADGRTAAPAAASALFATNADAVGPTLALSPAAAVVVVGVPESPPAAGAYALPTGGRTFYVDSRTGDDINDGLAVSLVSTGRGPWRSLQRIMTGGVRPGDVVLLACGGQWSETLRVPVSGTTSLPIVIGKSPAVGCTARPIVDGAAQLAPAQWTLYSGSIYKAALNTAPLQLNAASGGMTLAHHPNRGDVTADPMSVYLPLPANGDTVATAGGSGSKNVTLGTELSATAAAKLTSGARVRFRTNGWMIDESDVVAVSGRQLTLAVPTSFPLVTGWGYMLAGQAWMVDSPGEWHYDATTKQVIAWMPDSLPPNAAVRATLLATGIDLAGKQNVVIDGLVVQNVGTGINLRNSQAVRVRNSVFQDIAGRGADASASTQAVFESNAFTRTELDALTGVVEGAGFASAMTVTNNVIRDSGVVTQGDVVLSLPRRSVAAIFAGSDSVVTGNVIINAGYSGIRLMSRSLVEGNFVYGACSVLDDCGAIYIWADRDSTIRNNTVLHTRSAAAGKATGSAFVQGQGIYLDLNSVNVTVQGNTVIDADSGVHIHLAANNIVRGNRLYGNRAAQIWLQDTTDPSLTTGAVYDNTITGNQMAAVHPAAVGVMLHTFLASTAAFGTIDQNRYFDRSVATVVSESTATQKRAFTFVPWQQAANAGLPTGHDALGNAASATNRTWYSIAGSGVIPNSSMAIDVKGWSTWNQTLPRAQLIRETCIPGICGRLVAGGSNTLMSTPNFSIKQDQWYRMSVDVSTDTDGQKVNLVTRRGGGGTNGYESLSDRSLAFTANKSWKRYSVIFKANKTVNAADPITGDMGARVDIEGVLPGHSISMANLELVPISPTAFADLSRSLVNAGTSTVAVACPLAGLEAAHCNRFVRLDDDTPVAWPLTLPARSAVVMYTQDPMLTDTDRDGIPDSQDLCSNTPMGAPVNSSGCALIQR